MPCLVSVALVQVDITDSIYHVTTQDHAIEGSCNFVSGSSSLCITTLPSLVAVDRHCGNGGALICHTIAHDHAIKAP